MADLDPSPAAQGDPDSSSSDGDHPVGEKPAKTKKKSSFWRELPILILTALVLTFLIQTFLARVYVIPSQSMETTLHGCYGCTNDRVLVDKITYNFTDPKPGDVVVFRGPDSWSQTEFEDNRSENVVVRWFQELGSVIGLAPPNERDFVKRVIAVGGQTVECCTPDNKVKVDGKPLNEPYIHYEEGRGDKQEEFAPVKVPEGQLWMMGDNRNNSSDSRADNHGPVPVANVIGKAQFIVLPPSRWQGIDNPNPQAVALSAPAWQAGIPAGLGLAAAWPVLWLFRRTSRGIRSRMTRQD
ncbi:signal peptidase I [Allokutzneria albata]|uniref:Signal peptidase I n=1 Tax=Allokutzneria albata TaxID=211114 RepID=A0A1G9XDB5_ALLAB|nr:signal peptidase I [Allokutzneria albata]SDM94697.1 signal peptidase I [Allokutzneria albata]